jgi:hypothetical protein
MTRTDAIAAMRASSRHTLRRPGGRRPGRQQWVLLHAPSLLDGPGSADHAIALPGDDYRRLAARRQETRERHTKAPNSIGAMNASSPTSRGTIHE